MRNGYGFTEVDMNMGFIDPELLSPEQRGDDGEDDPADLDEGEGLPEGTHCVWEFHGYTLEDNGLDTWGNSRPRAVCTSRNLGDGVRRQNYATYYASR